MTADNRTQGEGEYVYIEATPETSEPTFYGPSFPTPPSAPLSLLDDLTGDEKAALTRLLLRHYGDDERLRTAIAWEVMDEKGRVPW